MQEPNVNLELSEFSKGHTPKNVYAIEYRRVMDEQYGDHVAIYTDGSKSEAGVGAAAVCGQTVKMTSLPMETSIFSSEVNAINIALDMLSEKAEKNFVIFSDSLSVVKSLHVHCFQPMIRRLMHRIHDFQTVGKIISVCWVPSHVGIEGIELADTAAKSASGRPEELIIQIVEVLLLYALVERWIQRWEACRDKLREIIPLPGIWIDKERCTRRDEVVINRVRMGHTLLTHGYLMNDGVPDVVRTL